MFWFDLFIVLFFCSTVNCLPLKENCICGAVVKICQLQHARVKEYSNLNSTKSTLTCTVRFVVSLLRWFIEPIEYRYIHHYTITYTWVLGTQFDLYMWTLRHYPSLFRVSTRWVTIDDNQIDEDWSNRNMKKWKRRGQYYQVECYEEWKTHYLK